MLLLVYRCMSVQMQNHTYVYICVPLSSGFEFGKARSPVLPGVTPIVFFTYICDVSWPRDVWRFFLPACSKIGSFVYECVCVCVYVCVCECVRGGGSLLLGIHIYKYICAFACV